MLIVMKVYFYPLILMEEAGALRSIPPLKLRAKRERSRRTAGFPSPIL